VKKKNCLQRPACREWPRSVRKLAGAWADLPSAEQLRKSRAKRIARRARYG
jgi:hypothetical protein